MILARFPIVVVVSLAWFVQAFAQTPQPLLILKGHTDPVSTVAVSPDGKILATGSFDKSVKLWDAATGKELRTLAGTTGHTNLVLGVAFAPDGLSLATVSTDNSLKIWDVATGQVKFNLAHPNIVHCAAFDKTGKSVATGCQDGILRIYDVTKVPGTVAKAINAHILPQGQSIYTVVWHPDGKRVASAGLDKSIKIWDAVSGNLLKEIKPGSDAPPLSATVLTTVPGLIGAAAGHTCNRSPPAGHKDQVYTLAFSKDGKQLASGSSDHTVKLWNPDSGTLIREFSNPNVKPAGTAHPGFVNGVRFTADGTRLFTVGNSPRLRGYLAVWNVADGKLLYGQELEFGPIHSVDSRADGSLVLGCGPRQRGSTDSEAVVLPFPVK